MALIVAMIVLAIVMGLSSIMLTYVTSSSKTAKLFDSELTALQIADAGLQKALFCLKTENGSSCGGSFGMDYLGEDSIDFGNGEFDIQIDCAESPGQGGGCAEADSDFLVTVIGTDASGRDSTVRAIISKQPSSSGVTAFNYALQVGGSGVEFSNNSVVCQGSIYSDSNISCGNGTKLLGDVVVSKPNGEIDGCQVRGLAMADRVTGSEVCCDAYFDDDDSGSTIHGASHSGSATPVVEPLPTVDLERWRAAATAGGEIDDDYEPGDGASIGPIKITGDLILNNNVDVTVTGPIWVMGNIELKNNATMTLDYGYGFASGVVLADNPSDNSAGGKISLGNNAYVTGSNTSGSYFLMISTNSSLDTNGNGAIDIYNNAAGDAIFYAMNGSVRLRNNSTAAAVAGERVELANNAVISYGCETNCSSSGSFCSCDAGSGGNGASLWGNFFRKLGLFGVETAAAKKKDKDSGGSGGGGGGETTSCWCESPETSECPTPDQIMLADGPEEWEILRGTWHEL